MTENLFTFLRNAPNSYFFVKEASKILEESGFKRIDEVPQNKENLPEKFYTVLNNSELAIFDYTGKRYIQELTGLIRFPALCAMPNCDDVVEGQNIVRLTPLSKVSVNSFVSTGLRASGIVYYETDDGKIDFKLYDSKTAIGQIPIIPVHYGIVDPNVDRLFAVVDEPLLTSISKQIGVPKEKITKHKIFFTSSEDVKLLNDEHVVASNGTFCLTYQFLTSFIEYANKPNSQKAKGLRVLLISENHRISTPKAASYAEYIESLIFGSDRAKFLKKHLPSIKIVDPLNTEISTNADSLSISVNSRIFYHHRDIAGQLVQNDVNYVAPDAFDEPDQLPVFYIDQPAQLYNNITQLVHLDILNKIPGIIDHYLSNPNEFVFHKEGEQEVIEEEEDNDNNQVGDVDDKIICVEDFPEPPIKDYTKNKNQTQNQVLKAAGIGAGVLLSGFVIYKVVKKLKE